jgi:glycosyltransferase involved in cell wall biosynthesis
MKICLVGGIYGKGVELRDALRITPEITLEHGLRDLGHSVSTFGHYAEIDYSRFDVVHVHHLSFGAIGAACSHANVPFVFTLHDPKVMQGDLSRIRALSLRFVLRRADAIIALSQMERDFLERTFRMEKRPEIIANGIDASVYSYVPKAGRPLDGRWSILYVGQLVEMKRVDCLLNALSLLPANTELKLAYHNARLEKQLRAQAQRLNLAERVHFLGAQTPSQLARLYQEADLFVLPSSGEALPSVVAEAMLCGTPVVATNVGGIVEQVGTFGITVTPGQADALAHAIKSIFSKYADFSERGRQMTEFARERSSIENMIQRHIQLYSKLASIAKPVRQKIRFHTPVNTLIGIGANVLCKAK